MSWVPPTFIEIDMSAEIGSYQDDFDPPAEPSFVAPGASDGSDAAVPEQTR